MEHQHTWAAPLLHFIVYLACFVLFFFQLLIGLGRIIWNISGANQIFCANYENFNLDHQINIQVEGRREVGGGICKSVITQSKNGSRL